MMMFIELLLHDPAIVLSLLNDCESKYHINGSTIFISGTKVKISTYIIWIHQSRVSFYSIRLLIVSKHTSSDKWYSVNSFSSRNLWDDPKNYPRWQIQYASNKRSSDTILPSLKGLLFQLLSQRLHEITSRSIISFFQPSTFLTLISRALHKMLQKSQVDPYQKSKVFAHFCSCLSDFYEIVSWIYEHKAECPECASAGLLLSERKHVLYCFILIVMLKRKWKLSENYYHRSSGL